MHNPFNNKHDIKLNTMKFHHMIAVLNAYIHHKKYISIAEKIKSMPPYTEDELNELAGWAGDLQKLIVPVVKNNLNIQPDDYQNQFDNAYLAIDENTKYTVFPYDEMLADIDGYNIAQLYLQNTNIPISNIFYNYYNSGINKTNTESSICQMFQNSYGGGPNFLGSELNTMMFPIDGKDQTLIVQNLKQAKLAVLPYVSQRNAIQMAFYEHLQLLIILSQSR